MDTYPADPPPALHIAQISGRNWHAQDSMLSEEAHTSLLLP